jgi:DNA-binding response OmpR family regulator
MFMIRRYRRCSPRPYGALMPTAEGSRVWIGIAIGEMESVRVLLADDERLLADTVADGLRHLAMAVDVCYDGEAAVERLSINQYDVAVLDRDMPRRTGDDVCRWMVSSGIGARVLILTAAAGIRDRVDGLGLGADDYLTKPFAFAELAARVQALARRPTAGSAPVLDAHGVVLDIPRHRAFRDGRLLNLTPKEFAVMAVLMRAPDEVVSSEQLLEQAWDEHADPFTNAVRVAVMTLRKKLGDPPIVHTVPRVGYRFGEAS